MSKIPMLEKFAVQSLVEHDGELIFSKEKFAELIVRECIDTINGVPNGYDDYRNQIEDAMREACVDAVKQKFGVE